MPLTVGWTDVAVRLALTVLAGLIFGINRGERGRAAGLRTNLLLCLAASVSMILANLLIDTRGKASDSFVNFDVMRLPLGILTGMGFIGAGAILRREDAVIGVTTAATLWLNTVVGLCFGAGQLALGVAATAIAASALWGLVWVEMRLPRQRRATLTLSTAADAAAEEALVSELEGADVRVESRSVAVANRNGAPHRTLRLELQWRVRSDSAAPPPVVDRLARQPGVRSVKWTVTGM